MAYPEAAGKVDIQIPAPNDVQKVVITLEPVDIVFRGLDEVKGRVIQSNGTPVIARVVIVRNVWRVSDGFFFLFQEPVLVSRIKRWTRRTLV